MPYPTTPIGHMPAHVHQTADIPFESMDALFEAFTQSTGALVTFVDLEGRMVYASRRVIEWFNRPPAEILGKTLRELYGEMGYAEIAPYLARATAGESVQYERHANQPDGSRSWISVTLTPHHDKHGKLVGIFTTALPINRLKQAEQKLDRTLIELSFHIENSPLAMVEWSGDIVINRWSPQAEKLFGWQADEVVGRRPTEIGLVHPDSLDTIRAITRELVEGKARRNRMLAKNMTRDGRTISCEWYNSALSDADGKLVSILSLAQDVTLRIEAEEQLRHAAVHDALTGLPNRQSWTARLEHAVLRARRSGDLLALLFIDLDKFKAVNDQYGHHVGDELLKQVAERLRTCVREADTVGRLGGDEFVVLLETHVTRVTPAYTAQRIDEALSRDYLIGDRRIEGGASIGVSLFPDDGDDADKLLARADAAMYRAKHA